MSKIIKITEDFVFVADEDKSVQKVPINAFDFTPKINQKIDVYQLEEEYIINKIDEKSVNKTVESDLDSLKDKININIVNENKPQNYNTNMNSNTQKNYSPYEPYRPGGVGKWTFILVSFFLGGFGGNFFMLRKPLMGFLSILFFWTYIPAIIACVHIIMALFKRPDKYGKIYF